MTALESRVAWYESLLKKLKSAGAEQRDALIRDIALDDHLGTVLSEDSEHPPASVSEPASPLPTGSLNRGTSGAMILSVSHSPFLSSAVY